MIEPAKMTVGGWNLAWVEWAEKRIEVLDGNLKEVLANEAALIKLSNSRAERIAELEEAAYRAKSILWKMQDGRVLDYSKPEIAIVIKTLSEALEGNIE